MYQDSIEHQYFLLDKVPEAVPLGEHQRQEWYAEEPAPEGSEVRASPPFIKAGEGHLGVGQETAKV